MGRGKPPRIVIAGGGIVGLVLALAFDHGLWAEAEVTICDPALGRASSGDLRASAIGAGGRRMLGVLGIWDAVARHAQPIVDMTVTDSRLDDPVRPVFLTFDGEVEPGEPFAHMVENGPLVAALREACARRHVVLAAAPVGRFTTDPHGVIVGLGDGREIEADLLVGADGARSGVRDMAGIGWVGWSYRQSGLVATLAHERDHAGQAQEHFLPSGPFAILPLTGRRSSIVWTERQADAEAFLALDAHAMLGAIERRFGLELGALRLDSEVKAYPVSIGIARRFVGDRLALVGEAAHVIHPLAGQGLNLGLRDAAALAEAVADAARLGLPPGEGTALAAYERARRFDSLAMAATTDVLNRLFSNDRLPVRLARDLGLGLVERLPGLKRAFMRRAAGLDGDLPALMQGQALGLAARDEGGPATGAV